MNKNRQLQRNGFTLVEVAIVIVFMGIFITFASSMLKSIALTSKSRAAREKLATASDAVQAWAVNKREIPSSFKSFTSASGNPRDYWNRTYAFYPYTTPNSVTRDICRRSSTNLAISPGGNCAGGNLIYDIAYVIMSGGDNLKIDAARDVSKPIWCIPIKDFSTSNDDLFKYVTLLELKKTVGCVEADSRLRIVTNDLPFANVSSNIFNTNSFYVEAAGGLPYVSNNLNKYRWSFTGNLPTGLAFSPVFTTYTTTQRLRIIGDPMITPSVPTQSGTFSVTVTATDNSTVPVSASKPFVITIKPKLP